MHNAKTILVATCSAILLGSPTLLAAPAFLRTCSECHGIEGIGSDDPAMPVLAGIPAEHLAEAIYAYVDGARNCVETPRMCETVAELSDKEVVEIAEYYSSKERFASRENFDKDLAAQGAVLHEKHCGRCHREPNRDDVASAVGNPLHGQKGAYLRLALREYLSGERESLVPRMAEAIDALQPGEFDALVHYYASYRSSD